MTGDKDKLCDFESLCLCDGIDILDQIPRSTFYALRASQVNSRGMTKIGLLRDFIPRNDLDTKKAREKPPAFLKFSILSKP